MPKKKKQHEDNIDFIEEDEEGTLHKLKTQLQKAKADLKECRDERQEYLTGWQRARADLINERREHTKKTETSRSTAQKDLLYDFLPILDSFDMAFANKDVWEKVDKNWRVGIEHIHNNLLTVLNQYGFTVDEPLGQTFDPVVHESVEMVDVDDPEQDHTIIDVLQKGYRHNGSVVRPAKVKVAVCNKKKGMP